MTYQSILDHLLRLPVRHEPAIMPDFLAMEVEFILASLLGVIDHPLEVDKHYGIVPDDPRIVSGRQE